MEVERLDSLRRCSSTTVFQNHKLRALLAVTFPPVRELCFDTKLGIFH